MWKFLLVGVFAAAAGIGAIFALLHFTTSATSYPTAFEIKLVKGKDGTDDSHQITYYNYTSAKIKNHNDLLCAPIVTAESGVDFAEVDETDTDGNIVKVPIIKKASFNIDSKPVDSKLATNRLRVLYQIIDKEIVIRQIEQIVVKGDYELFTLNDQLTKYVAFEVAQSKEKDPITLKGIQLNAIKKGKKNLFKQFEDNSGKAETVKYVYNCESFLETKNQLDATGNLNLVTKQFEPESMKRCLREIQKFLSTSH